MGYSGLGYSGLGYSGLGSGYSTLGSGYNTFGSGYNTLGSGYSGAGYSGGAYSSVYPYTRVAGLVGSSPYSQYAANGGYVYWRERNIRNKWCRLNWFCDHCCNDLNVKKKINFCIVCT